MSTDKYLMGLKEVAEYGFNIQENVTGVLEIRDVDLDKDIDFATFEDYGFNSEVNGYNYDLSTSSYGLFKDGEEILENVTLEEITQFFLTGVFVNYMKKEDWPSKEK